MEKRWKAGGGGGGAGLSLRFAEQVLSCPKELYITRPAPYS